MAGSAPTWVRRSLLVMAGGLIGFGFGFGMSLLPAPKSPGVFWIGNLCAPWLALAFVAGLVQRRALPAAVAGFVVEISCVVGFYFDFLLLGPSALGLPDGTPLGQYVVPLVEGWLRFTSAWLIIAAGAGVVWGLLGAFWHRSAPRAAAVAVTLLFLSEPALWTAVGHRVPPPVWIIEIGAAAVALVLLLRHRGRRRGRSIRGV